MDLTDAQWHLLGELVTAGLADPSHSGDSAASAAARGIDLQSFPAEVALLAWLKLTSRVDDEWVATDLGAALHYRRLYESAELRLSEVARFAATNEASAPEFNLAVRRLAQGSTSFEEALRGPRRTA
ncbi:hypothetical protein [Streptomyces cyaneofuscatus]|uniref:hypothetical protein n=1 Tax=Streptomyces cyaneofuscatus TaxID=66883 RepID=UPI003687310E